MRSFEVAESAEALSLVYRGLFLSNEGWGGSGKAKARGK